MLSLLLFLRPSLHAGPVRISFLTDERALHDTLNLLEKAGCESDARADFGKAVLNYNAKGLKFDTSRFPPARFGVYSFASISRLLSVWPSRLSDCGRSFDLNCFDTVIIVASGEFRTGLRPDERFDEFLPAGVMTNGDLAYAHAQTAREAFNLSYPAWYQETTSNYFSPSLVKTRMVLTPAMYCFHMLPASTNPSNMEMQVIEALGDCWSKQKILFPSNFQVVLCHDVSLTRHFFVTTHAGVLFPEANGYVYLEKDGGRGPFVRLDLQDKTELLAYLAGTLTNPPGTYTFATFNDREIDLLMNP